MYLNSRWPPANNIRRRRPITQHIYIVGSISLFRHDIGRFPTEVSKIIERDGNRLSIRDMYRAQMSFLHPEIKDVEAK